MIARVFPRRASATPDDEYAFIGEPPMFLPPGITKIMVSCLFTWDRPEAERLARSWGRIAPVEVGGPAYDSPVGAFEPGMFVKHGYTVTSRGCPNNCWFCAVPRREGNIRELQIRDGWNVLDSNLLACSESHIKRVFAMLKRQDRAPEFTGGLEAKRLEEWHTHELKSLKPKQVFFAYDTPDDLIPLERAAFLMFSAGFTKASHAIRAYLLIGYPGDTLEKAERRLDKTLSIGVFPMAMLYRDESGKTNAAWKKLQRKWARPAIISAASRQEVAA